MWDKPSLIPKPNMTTPRRLLRALNTPSRIPKPTRNYSRDEAFKLPLPDRSPTRRTPAKPPQRVLTPAKPSTLKHATPRSTPYRCIDGTREDLQPAIERNLADSFINFKSESPHVPAPARQSSSFSQFRRMMHYDEDEDDEVSPFTPSPRSKPTTARSTHNAAVLTPSPKAKDVYIDEDLIARTPAKEKNDEWLQAFGIDISLLKICDETTDENAHPNITPKRNPDNTSLKSISSNLHTSQAYDNFFDDEPEDDHPIDVDDYMEEPVRPAIRVVTPHRRTRRPSVRVSTRELESLSIQSEAQQPRRPRARGSEVFLTPVRASRRQREHTGTPLVVSEVRRSLRINKPNKDLVPKDALDERNKLLERNQHSYIPNPSLNE